MTKKLLNKWDILETDNSGGFSTIYKVTNDQNEIFAVKKVENNKEIEILNKIKNIKNVIDIVNIEKDENTQNTYVFMEYLPNLKTYFKDKEISNNDVVNIAIDICGALEELEKIEMIHTDIKPSNIFISDGVYKLGDFGSAIEKNNVTQNREGTLNYIAPELYHKKSIDSRVDQYSLGIVMYYLLAGDLPFVSDNISEENALKIRLKGDKFPVIENVEDNLMNIILKACSFDKRDRYENISQMKKDLEKLNIKTRKLKKIEFIPNEHETTISIYDENLLNSQPTKKNIINKKRKKRKLNSKKIILVLLVLIIPVSLLIHYSINKTCNVGYVNKNGFCIKGSYYCPENYALNENKKCQKTIESIDAKVTYVCKKGYKLAGDLCVSEDVKEIENKLECLDGFTLKGQKCERVESADAYATFKCPSGYVSSGEQCVTVTNQPANETYKCEDSSYTMNGTVCSKVVNKTLEPSIKYECNSGGTLNGTMCEYVESPSYKWFYSQSCSKGTLDYKDMKCHYTESAKQTYTCTQGNLSNGKCIYNETVTKQAILSYSCPSGYVTIGSECAKTTGIAATVKYLCSDGAVLKGKKCYTTISMDAVKLLGCPDGYIPNGTTCIKEGFLQAVKKYTCSRVYVLNGGKCEKYDIIPAKIMQE